MVRNFFGMGVRLRRGSGMGSGDRKKSGRWTPTIIARDGKIIRVMKEQGEEEVDWVSLYELFRLDGPLFRNLLHFDASDEGNTFLVVGEYLTVVDPGSDYAVFSQLFERPEYAPEDIRKVVLTRGQGRPDHAMGTIELFRYRSIRNNPELEILIHSDGPRELKKILKQFGARVIEVRGGETVDLGGFDWRVIHTPGYTGDGICLYYEPARTLISGGITAPRDSAVMNGGAGGHAAERLASLRSLLQLDIEVVLPGHGPLIASAGRKALERNYLAALLGAITSGAGVLPTFDEAACAAVKAGLIEDAEFCRRMAPAAGPDSR